MGSFMMHHAIGMKVLNYFDYNTNDFILGNILPDSAENSAESHAYAHFRKMINGEYQKYSNIEMFKNKYDDHFDNSIILGYYCHLLSDTIWRKTRPQKVNDIDKTLYTNIIHEDFIKLNKILIDHYKLEIPNKLIIPEEIVITEIDERKIIDTINGFYHQFEIEYKGEPKILTIDYISDYIDNAVEFCVEHLK